MEYLTKENGLMEKERDSESKSGLMAQNMLGNGETTKPMARVHSFTLMAMFMKENGSMTKLVAKEPIHMKMVPNMLDNGKTINRTATVLNNGSMDKFTKESTRMEQKPGRVS